MSKRKIYLHTNNFNNKRQSDIHGLLNYLKIPDNKKKEILEEIKIENQTDDSFL